MRSVTVLVHGDDNLSGGTFNRDWLDHGASIEHVNEPESLAFWTNARLRAAIRNNAVTFPSQMMHQHSRADGDRSERIVQLYFVSGWSVQRLCGRYQLSRPKLYNILSEWRHRAIAAGFVQEIQPQSEETKAPNVPTADGTIGARDIQDICPQLLATLVNEEDVSRQEALEQSASNSDLTGSVSAWEMPLPRRAVSTGAHL